MPLSPGKLSIDEMTQAWRRATDTDIRGALQDSEGLDAQVIAIIQAEAGFRGIKIEQKAIIRTISLGRRVRSLLNDHLKARSPLISFIAGAAYVAVPRIVGPYLTGISSGLWYVFWLGVSIVANAILCWPLRSYRKAFINTLVFILPNLLWFVVSSFEYYAAFPPSVWGYTAMVLFGHALSWIFHFGLLSGIIWYRRKYQPVFPEGHCRRCGYNLTGLPSPRCPECGTGFEVG